MLQSIVPSWHGNCLPKSIPLLYQATFFRMVGNMTRLVISLSIGLLPHFFCHGVSLLIRSKAVCISMMVGKAFYKSMADSFGRSTVCREGKSVPEEMSFPATAPCIMEAVQGNQSIMRQLADHIGNGTTWGLTVGLYCSQTDSAVGSARSALVNRSLHC